MIKACIFDMDGTVVNSLGSIAYFANSALNDAGLPSIDVEEYKYLVGNGARTLIERALKRVEADEKLFSKVFSQYCTTYENNFLYLTEPYDGVISMLKALKDKGIVNTILSNKPHSTAIKVSDALFGDNLIDKCYGAREGIALKPDPAGVFEIVKELGLSKEECIYIGDTSTDMKTGKSAGLYTVGVLWGFRKRDELEDNGADAIISHPSELLHIIDKLS